MAQVDRLPRIRAASQGPECERARLAAPHLLALIAYSTAKAAQIGITEASGTFSLRAIGLGLGILAVLAVMLVRHSDAQPP